MLENLLFSLNVVLPVFIMITLGFLGVRFKVIDRETMNKLSRVTFNWFLSVKIFLSTYDAPLEELAGLTMAWYCCAAPGGDIRAGVADRAPDRTAAGRAWGRLCTARSGGALRCWAWRW